jgi:hypothetical protein
MHKFHNPDIGCPSIPVPGPIIHLLLPIGAAYSTCVKRALPGVFAVGGVRAGSIKWVAAAAGEGSMALRLVQQCLGLIPA